MNPSMKEALFWLRKSAGQGNTEAQELLAELGDLYKEVLIMYNP